MNLLTVILLILASTFAAPVRSVPRAGDKPSSIGNTVPGGVLAGAAQDAVNTPLDGVHMTLDARATKVEGLEDFEREEERDAAKQSALTLADLEKGETEEDSPSTVKRVVRALQDVEKEDTDDDDNEDGDGDAQDASELTNRSLLGFEKEEEEEEEDARDAAELTTRVVNSEDED